MCLGICGAFKGLGKGAEAGLGVATSGIDSQAIASLNAIGAQASNKLDLFATPIDYYNQRGNIRTVTGG